MDLTFKSAHLQHPTLRIRSLNNRIHIRSTKLPKDFFHSAKSVTKTRASSASKSKLQDDILGTPCFGRKGANVVEYRSLHPRRKDSYVSEAVQRRAYRYGQLKDSRILERKLGVQLPLIGKKTVSACF